jgi:predicted ester cyclase
MKKIFFVAIAAALGITSCNDAATTKTSDAREKNMAANDGIGKAFETGDVSKIDSFVSIDFIDHTDQGDKKGPDSLKAMVKMMHSSFKDMKMETIHEVADDDYVFSWMHYTGTSDGAMGMPKGPYSMNATEVSKYKDGKAVEHWSFLDMKDMMKMMPQPNMGEMNKMDTTKMK